MPNMILYLMRGYNMKAVDGSNVLFIWSAVTHALAIFGAFLSDAYLGRFRVIALGSFSSLTGMILLWFTAVIPGMKPQPCEQFKDDCNPATPAQLAVLFSSFGLISIGAGCIRPCSMAFGADQLDKENPDSERILDSFFNWYYASSAMSTVISLTIIVYIQDHLGWNFGFGVPAILMFFSALMFLFGSSLYVKEKPSSSLFTGFVQVPFVAFKNRHLNPPCDSDEYYHHSHDKKLTPTNQLRWLNRACMIRDPGRDLSSDGSDPNSWSICSVEQVESLKTLLRLIPIWSTGIMILVSMGQTSFTTLQANTMDRYLTPNFKIPAASFAVSTVVVLTIWIPIYDIVLVPILARYTGCPRGLSMKFRMGIGLVLSCVAMAVGAITESVRRRIANEQGLDEQPAATLNMSAMWLLPQFILFGFAEAFSAIGQIEFYYSQFSKSMSSIAVALFTVGIAGSNLVGSLLVNVVNSVTSKGGKESWLSSNLNKGHLDYYYWLITILCLINIIYFLVCCWSYGPFEDEKPGISDEGEANIEYRALPSS
ncbi:hypothetical protein VitviT2T_004646 [Vitis vinifera]|nr:hypothetical protein VitviT2T_004646 [Vitis vinifera]